jgi:hypothetical protein
MANMKLRSDIYAMLLHALVSAFDRDELELMLRLECSWRLDEIAEPGNLRLTVHQVIRWCEQKGKVAVLVSGALNYNPDAPDLQCLRKVDWAQVEEHPAEAPSEEWLLETPNWGGQPGVQGGSQWNGARRPALPPLVGAGTTAGSQPTAAAPERRGPSDPLYAPVYGIIVGVTRYEGVRQLLGEPELCPRSSSGKPVVEYGRHGLRITLAGEIQHDPHIDFLRVNAEEAWELPFGLQRTMQRAEWDGIMRKIYGPAEEVDNSPSATYSPPQGCKGNTVRIHVKQGCIGSLLIY